MAISPDTRAVDWRANIADGYRVWNERWDRRLEDIFDVQDEIARAVVSALQLDPAALPDVVRRTGRAVRLRSDPSLPATSWVLEKDDG